MPPSIRNLSLVLEQDPAGNVDDVAASYVRTKYKNWEEVQMARDRYRPYPELESEYIYYMRCVLLGIKYKDPDESRPTKKSRPNPLGEDAYLLEDLTVTNDEDKIIRAQRIFLHNHYKPGGKGMQRVMSRLNGDVRPEN